MKVTSVSLTPTSVTVEWDLVQGDVTTVSLGHKTPTARARRDVSDYRILRGDIDPTERVVTVSGDFDLSEDNVFVVFVYEGNLTQPTGQSDENQGTARAGRYSTYFNMTTKVVLLSISKIIIRICIHVALFSHRYLMSIIIIALHMVVLV